MNSAARSMVSRMYRRWSAARAPMGMGSGRGAWIGLGDGTKGRIRAGESLSSTLYHKVERFLSHLSPCDISPDAVSPNNHHVQNICTLSRIMLTLVAGECDQRGHLDRRQARDAAPGKQFRVEAEALDGLLLENDAAVRDETP